MKIRALVSFDWALKKLLRSKANYEILEGFLSELLKEEIKIKEILESEGNKETRKDKHNRVDLKVVDSTGDIVIIEVQYSREYDYLQRILYGTAKAITEHLDESDPYSEVKKIISVNILYFDLGHGEDYVYHGKTVFKGIHKEDELLLSEKQKEYYRKEKIAEVYPDYYLIKINQFDDKAKDTLDEWIYFLKNEEIKDGFKAKGLKAAKKTLDILKLSKADRIAYESYIEDLHYQASMYESTYLFGTKAGRKAGRMEGRKEGRKEGAEAEKRKSEAEKRKNIKKIHEKGVAIKLISEVFGLPVTAIKKIVE